MEIAINILVILIWIIFAIASGYTEAPFWYYRNKVKANYKIKWYSHQGWTVMRAMLAIPLVTLLIPFYSWYVILAGVSLMLVFPFLHDGAYYYFRNTIDSSYPRGWFDTSTTSTAKTTLATRTRSIALLVGIYLYLSMILISKGI